MTDLISTGILLPESILFTRWFDILAAFTAINTIIYVVLAVVKTLPRLRLPKRNQRNRRSQTRNIYPDAPA
ncbi:hypothetical protein [Flaviflexus equikiangi]|uniref:Uncharacterized protein n=1 Tax=Flaviflexus equikiangi TaxID=2758573 RepID=A0ABS2TI05_9ACTO|nr:hypothetical protein [Flaviflexus equikiangi]MBM9433181.1 hypothetical protein [Flaviflexus equikiangi]